MFYSPNVRYRHVKTVDSRCVCACVRYMCVTIPLLNCYVTPGSKPWYFEQGHAHGQGLSAIAPWHTHKTCTVMENHVDLQVTMSCVHKTTCFTNTSADNRMQCGALCNSCIYYTSIRYSGWDFNQLRGGALTQNH